MFNHVVIIRFHYPKGSPIFKWRLAYFKAMVLPRLLNQTNKDFDIAIRCNPEHRKIFESLNKKIRTFDVKPGTGTRRIKKVHGKNYFLDFVRWDDVVGLGKYEIQSGLDSDDLISLDYIQTIKDEIKKNDSNRSLHISFQPDIFDMYGLKKMSIGCMYSDKRGSAFFTIYQPKDKKKYIFAYEASHLVLPLMFEKSVILPVGKCWATVHGLNESTTLCH